MMLFGDTIMTRMFLSFCAFWFGSIVGSFLNVCILRLPQKKSLLFPSSHCPHCQQPIRFYDNIPLISYFVLRGGAASAVNRSLLNMSWWNY